MNRHSIIIIFAAVAVFVIIFGVSNKSQLGSNYESYSKGYYYYYPAQSKESGVIAFNKLRSKDKDGIKIAYTNKTLYDANAAETADSLSKLPKVSSNSRKDVGNNLSGEYSTDGKLKYVGCRVRNSEDIRGLTGQNYTTYYLALTVNDSSGYRAADHAAVCGKMYAEDIVNSLSISEPDKEITRLYIKCGYSDSDGYTIDAYTSDDTTGFDEKYCDKITLLSADGKDCRSYLQALICSDSMNEKNMTSAAQTAVDLLNGEYASKLNRSPKFFAILVADEENKKDK